MNPTLPPGGRRIASVFADGRKGLIGYLMAGDPDFDTSLAILREAIAAGLDILELGVPFSDPTSDGPVIEAAAGRALKSGMSVSRVLELVRRIREHSQIPVILFSYCNPLLQYGPERLARQCRDLAIDGLLIVDMPPEESADFMAPFAGTDIAMIRLLAPTTVPDRVGGIVSSASGFLYLITRTGVTGGGKPDLEAIRTQVEAARQRTSLPICLGFGIGSAADVRLLAPLADGLIVGSALVRLVPEGDGAPARIAAKVRELKQAFPHG